MSSWISTKRHMEIVCQLEAENERRRKEHEELRTEIAVMRGYINGRLKEVYNELKTENQRLRDELEEARHAGVTTAKPSLVRDAERYRWLLEHHEKELYYIAWSHGAVGAYATGTEAIDAAMKGENT